MMPLRIMTRNFELLDEINRYSNLQINWKWHDIGKVDLVISRYLKGADKLQRDYIIFHTIIWTKAILSVIEKSYLMKMEKLLQVLSKSRLIYQKDYDLGDTVTLQNKEWGVTLDARITEVKKSMSREYRC